MSESEPSLTVRVVLGAAVGIGFVTPAVAAALGFLDFSDGFAILVGLVVGIGVFALILTRTKRVRR